LIRSSKSSSVQTIVVKARPFDGHLQLLGLARATATHSRQL